MPLTDALETARALNAMNEGYLLQAFDATRSVSVEQAVEALWPPWRELLALRPTPQARAGAVGAASSPRGVL